MNPTQPAIRMAGDIGDEDIDDEQEYKPLHQVFAHPHAGLAHEQEELRAFGHFGLERFILKVFHAIGLGDRVVTGRYVQSPKRIHDMIFIGDLLVIGSVVAKHHVYNGADDKNENGREQDRHPECSEEFHFESVL
jgi:hypothetical protein